MSRRLPLVARKQSPSLAISPCAATTAASNMQVAVFSFIIIITLKEKTRTEERNPHLVQPFSRWISQRRSVSSCCWIEPWRRTTTTTGASHFRPWPDSALQRTIAFRGCAFPCEAQRFPACTVARWSWIWRHRQPLDCGKHNISPKSPQARSFPVSRISIYLE